MKKQMVKVITTFVMISVLLVLVACGQSTNKSVNSSVNSPENNNQSESPTEQSVKEVENTKDSSGDMEWSESKLNLSVGLFKVSILKGWAFSKSATLAIGLTTSDDSYRLVIDGYSAV